MNRTFPLLALAAAATWTCRGATILLLEAGLNTGSLPAGCSMQTVSSPELATRFVDCPATGPGVALPTSSARVTVSGPTTYLAAAGNSTWFGPDVPVSASSRARLETSLTMSGGVGHGTLLVEYILSCSGSNQARSTRPRVSVTAGSVTAQSNVAEAMCDPRFGALEGSLAVPFDFDITQITLTLDTLAVQSLKGSSDPSGSRSVQARLRVLDANQFEQAGVTAVPEPGTLVAGVSALIVLIRARGGKRRPRP